MVVFPAWARLALGLLVALAGILIVGLHADESTKQLVLALSTILAAQGIVPPTPGSIRLSPSLNLMLTIAATIAAYLLTGADGISEELRQVLSGVLLFVTSVVITPVHASGPGTPRPT